MFKCSFYVVYIYMTIHTLLYQNACVEAFFPSSKFVCNKIRILGAIHRFVRVELADSKLHSF